MTRVLRVAAAVSVAVSLGLGVLEWTPLVAAAVFVMVLCLVVVCLAVAADLRGTRKDPRRLARRSADVTAALVGCWALTSFSPALGALVVVLWALVATACRAAVRRRPAGPAGSRSTPCAPPASPAASSSPGPSTSDGTPPERPGPAPDSFPFEALDDRTLCGVWRESFWDLCEQTTADGLLRVVRLRQRCLDELERRDAAAIHAWLEHGARASGGPEKYWHRPGTGSADAA